MSPAYDDDDYSFDPLGADNGYNGHAIPRYYETTEGEHHHHQEEQTNTGGVETIAFGNESSIPTTNAFSSIFHEGNTKPSSSSNHSNKSNEEEIVVYAPPGKVGVAIDVIDGQPVVHKIRNGSPLENKLLPNDIILSIDNVNTSCMSAADVTNVMVRKMNYQRKITVRRRTKRGSIN